MKVNNKHKSLPIKRGSSSDRQFSVELDAKPNLFLVGLPMNPGRDKLTIRKTFSFGLSIADRFTFS